MSEVASLVFVAAGLVAVLRVRREGAFAPALFTLACLATAAYIALTGHDNPSWSGAGPAIGVLAAFLALAAAIRVGADARRHALDKRRADALHEELKSFTQEASSQIEASEKRFREVAQIVPVGLFESNASGELILVSARWCELTGLNRKRALGWGWLEGVEESERELFRRSWIDALERSVPLEGELFFPGQESEGHSGAGRWIRWHSIPHRDITGEIVGQVGTIADVTERRLEEERRTALERRERQAQKSASLGVLAGGLAHDFNNLLVGVLGNADILMRRLPGDSPLREIVENIAAAGTNASDLSRQLLAFAGGGRLKVVPVDVSLTVGELVRLLTSTLLRDAHIELELDPSLPLVEIDPSQLRQVALNLLTNAVEAAGESDSELLIRSELVELAESTLGSVMLRCDAKKGEYISLSVRDSAGGVEPEVLEHLFDPFYSTKATGRGLGLAVVIGIVRASGGAIDVETQAGDGTQFTVYLPVSVSQKAPPQAAEVTVDGWSSESKVLVVDDDESVRSIVRTILESHGLKVEQARNGPEGIAQLRRKDAGIDLVLLDVIMPEMNGEEVYEIVREMEPDLPVIFMSGYRGKGALRRFDADPSVRFVAKPFRADGLVGAVRAALERGGKNRIET